MEKTLRIFPDGSLYELVGEEAVKVTQTEGKVQLLIEALQFTQAETFTIASDDSVPPEVIGSRAALRRINAEGLKLIKHFEGLYLEAYLDPIGKPTIGWGHTETAQIGMKITRNQAEELLKKDLAKFEAAVADAVKINVDDNQFSALVSFSYNVGARALFESTLLKFLNQGKIQETANEFLRWDKAGKQVLLGLSRRRKAERALFLSQPWLAAYNGQNGQTSQLMQLAKPGEPLRQGDDVRQLQQALINAGFSIEADGFFGVETDKAVKEFQEQQGLTVDGIVGGQTLAKIGLKS